MVSTAQINNKRKRVSKKNKKAWRKHTNIEDVEKFLEEKLREERTGGDPKSKKNTELFYIDKSDIFESSKSKLSNLKCHSDSQVDTRVLPVSSYTGPKKKKKKTSCLTSTQEIVSSTKDTKTGMYDIWASNSSKQNTLKHKPESNSSAVELPHPGASYNPTFTSHQELLQKVLDVEVKREKVKEKIARDAPPPIKITEEDYIREMSIGLNNNKEGEETGEETEEETEVMLDVQEAAKKSVNVRKTRVQRNKEKAEKVKADELRAAKLEKQRVHELTRIKALKKEIRKEEQSVSDVTKVRQAKKSATAVRPGKFGPKKLLETEPEFLLPEEISSSLRKLEPQGDAAQDRFLSLQKRNMIEVRKKVTPHRKYKLKYVEKWRMKLPEEIKELTKTKRKQKKKIKVSE